MIKFSSEAPQMHTKLTLSFAAMALSVTAFGQFPAPTPDSFFQIRYAANLTSGDSVINLTNTGANGASLNGPGFGGIKTFRVALGFCPFNARFPVAVLTLTPTVVPVTFTTTEQDPVGKELPPP